MRQLVGALAVVLFMVGFVIGLRAVISDEGDTARASDGGSVATSTPSKAGETATPTKTEVPKPPPTATSSPATAACPSDGEMQRLFGFDKLNPPIKPVFTGGPDIPWEPCKWNLQWVSSGTLALTMLPNWQFTVTEASDTVSVWYGDGQTRSIKGATIRYTPAYVGNAGSWVTQGCTLLQKELEFGNKRTPSYDTVNGNVCINGVGQPALTSGTTMPSGSGTVNTILQECANATPQQVAQAIGGNAASWTREDPTNFPTTWKYKSKGTFVQLANPGPPTTIDYWSGGVKTATQAGPLPILVDEATLKCTGN